MKGQRHKPLSNARHRVTWKRGPIAGVLLRPALRHADTRGWLTEIYRCDELPDRRRPVMGYVSVTHPGHTRGPHAHRRQTDMFALVGPGDFRITMWDNRPASPTFGNVLSIRAGQSNPIIVTVPPGVVHGYVNTGRTDAWVLNFPDRLYRGAGRRHLVDEIRYEEDKRSPFVLGGTRSHGSRSNT